MIPRSRARASSLSLLGLASLLSVVALPRPVRAQSPAITLDDFTQLVRVSDPQISPDGRSIAVVVARANLEDNRYDTELVLVDVATKATRSLTFERPGLRQPRWSPKGDRLAFLAAESNNPDAKRQLWVLPLAGGDARRITSAPLGVQQFAWSPRGDSIAYVTADTLPKGKGAERHNDSFEVGNNELSAKAAQAPSHIWLINATGGVPRRLTSGPWSLPTTPPPGSPPFALSWSPDGKALAYVRQEHPPFGDADSAHVEVLDVATGASRRLTGGSTFERIPGFSPDGGQTGADHPVVQAFPRAPGQWGDDAVHRVPDSRPFPRGAGARSGCVSPVDRVAQSVSSAGRRTAGRDLHVGDAVKSPSSQ
jgi:dipeptidyl aminopeptidase/acylaminoacyl peptidase